MVSMADEIKTKTLRATDEQMAKLKEISESGNFKNQGEALAMLIDVYERDQAKVAIPERATEIEDFNLLLRKISNKFIYSLELNLNAEERAKLNFQNQLSIYEGEIRKLREEVDKFNESNRALKTENSEYSKKVEILNKEHDTEKKDLEEKIARFTESVAEKTTIISALQNNINIQDEKIKKLQEQANNTPELLNKINQLETELNESRKAAEEYKLAAERSKNEAESAANIKISEIQGAFIERMNTIQDRADKAISKERKYCAEKLAQAREALVTNLSEADTRKLLDEWDHLINNL